jgi:hypothetical protein
MIARDNSGEGQPPTGMSLLQTPSDERGFSAMKGMSDGSPLSREGLALIFVDRIAKGESCQENDRRRYFLDLLREVLLTIDGKRAPPVVIPTIDRRVGSIDRRECAAERV